MTARACRLPATGALWIVAVLLIGMVAAARSAEAEDALVSMALPEGNLVAVGVGAYPDYLGSNDYSIGAVPLGRYQFWGRRDVTLLGNTLNVNLLDVPGWRLGPSAMLRFGRSDVDDAVVRRVHEVDPSIDVGPFIGYTWVHSDEPRIRVGVRAWALWDVTDSHGGWTTGASVFGSYPILKPLTLGGGVGTTYGSGSYMSTQFSVTPADALASGLAVYRADAALRDARAWLLALLHLSKSWSVGGGVIYSRLADEAARSPIVSDRGSRDQFVYGIGAMYLW